MTTLPAPLPSLDGLVARNNTLINLLINGQRVGRVQQFREEINNNVQVLAELGSQFMVQINKGITSYSFSLARFVCRNDAMDVLKKGQIFGLEVQDTGDGGVSLEYFPSCAIANLSNDYTIGQASVGQNATVAVIGEGVGVPKVLA